MRRLLRVALRCRHFHGRNAIPPECLKWLTAIYDRIIKVGLAFHTVKIPLPCKGKGGRQPKRTGHNLLLYLFHYKQDVLRFLHDPDVPFTNNVDRLVYYKQCDNIVVAIEREKQIKGWSRKKKNDLVNSFNPEWNDLYQSIC